VCWRKEIACRRWTTSVSSASIFAFTTACAAALFGDIERLTPRPPGMFAGWAADRAAEFNGPDET
jgi:hypothetical protein